MKSLFNDNKMYDEKVSQGNWIWKAINPIIIFELMAFAAVMVFMIGYIVGVPNINLETLNVDEIVAGNNAMFIQIISQVLALIVLYLIYRKEKIGYPKVVKESSKYLWVYGALLIATVGVISGFLVNLIASLIPSFADSYKSAEELFAVNPVLTFISTCLLAPIVEEILCRGLILNRLLSKKGIWLAIIISAFCFGLIHLNLVQGFNSFVLGIIMAIVYIKTRSLWPCIIGHFLNNLLSFILSSANSLTNYIVCGVVVLISIYPIILFIKKEHAKIDKCELVANE